MQQICIDCVIFSTTAIGCERAADAARFEDISSAVSAFLSNGARHVVIIEQPGRLLGQTIASALDTQTIAHLVICTPAEGHWSIERGGGTAAAGLRGRTKTLDEALELIQEACGRTHNRTVSVSGDADGLKLCRFSRLHFHVGDSDVLNQKRRGVVPLIGQWECGVANVLLHFAASSWPGEAVIDHADVVRFTESAYRFYASANAPSFVLAKARRAAAALVERFPTITGVFAGGYPFYLAEDSNASFDSTPPSILHYLDVQRRYFARKIISEETYGTMQSRVFSKDEVSQILGLTLQRNEFDEYEFAKFGVPPPPVPPDGHTIGDYLALNCLDLAEDVWPCHYCSVLQNADLYPRQGVTKEFTRSCLSCRQTTMLPRNVTGCSSDVDLVAVVDGNVAEAADQMKAFLTGHSEFHIYDTDFPRMFIDNNGPVDLFVVDAADLWASLDELAHGAGDWTRVMLPSLAVWLPVTPHDLEFGSNFVLCFEPLWIASERLRERLTVVRNCYASRVTAAEVFERLGAGAFYHRQLIGNAQVREVMSRKLQAWRRPLGP